MAGAVHIDLSGRTALVTGSTQGIGAAVAARLTEPEGIAHVVTCLASPLASASTGGALRVDGYVDRILP